MQPPDAGFTQRIEPHYALPVLVRDHEGVDPLNASLVSLIRELEQRHRGTRLDATHMRECTTQGGFQTSGNSNFLDIDHAATRQLRDQLIKPAIDAYLEDALDADPFAVRYRLFSWSNILRAGDWQAPHMHPTEFNIISGVYYVSAPALPEPQGWIEFLNPHPISTMHGGTSSRRHAPRTGQLLMFPPYYMHFVHPFRGDSERAIVAFDVRVAPPGGG